MAASSYLIFCLTKTALNLHSYTLVYCFFMESNWFCTYMNIFSFIIKIYQYIMKYLKNSTHQPYKLRSLIVSILYSASVISIYYCFLRLSKYYFFLFLNTKSTVLLKYFPLSLTDEFLFLFLIRTFPFSPDSSFLFSFTCLDLSKSPSIILESLSVMIRAYCSWSLIYE